MASPRSLQLNSLDASEDLPSPTKKKIKTEDSADPSDTKDNNAVLDPWEEAAKEHYEWEKKKKQDDGSWGSWTAYETSLIGIGHIAANLEAQKIDEEQSTADEQQEVEAQIDEDQTADKQQDDEAQDNDQQGVAIEEVQAADEVQAAGTQVSQDTIADAQAVKEPPANQDDAASGKDDADDGQVAAAPMEDTSAADPSTPSSTQI